MSTKQYLNMADVKALKSKLECDKCHLIMSESRWFGELISEQAAEYAAHAINSHDELVAENERLVSVLWEVDRVLSEMQKNGVLVYGLDDLIDEVNHSIQS